jgi:hypothetical protein
MYDDHGAAGKGEKDRNSHAAEYMMIFRKFYFSKPCINLGSIILSALLQVP